MIYLLEERVSIVIAKYKYGFQENVVNIKNKLKELFKVDYNESDIEQVIQKIEVEQLDEIYNQEKEGLVLIDKNDFELKNLNIWV